jgi:hypothetical protein
MTSISVGGENRQTLGNELDVSLNEYTKKSIATRLGYDYDSTKIGDSIPPYDFKHVTAEENPDNDSAQKSDKQTSADPFKYIYASDLPDFIKAKEDVEEEKMAISFPFPFSKNSVKLDKDIQRIINDKFGRNSAAGAGAGAGDIFKTGKFLLNDENVKDIIETVYSCFMDEKCYEKGQVPSPQKTIESFNEEIKPLTQSKYAGFVKPLYLFLMEKFLENKRYENWLNAKTLDELDEHPEFNNYDGFYRFNGPLEPHQVDEMKEYLKFIIKEIKPAKKQEMTKNIMYMRQKIPAKFGVSFNESSPFPLQEAYDPTNPATKDCHLVRMEDLKQTFNTDQKNKNFKKWSKLFSQINLEDLITENDLKKQTIVFANHLVHNEDTFRSQIDCFNRLCPYDKKCFVDLFEKLKAYLESYYDTKKYDEQALCYTVKLLRHIFLNINSDNILDEDFEFILPDEDPGNVFVTETYRNFVVGYGVGWKAPQLQEISLEYIGKDTTLTHIHTGKKNDWILISDKETTTETATMDTDTWKTNFDEVSKALNDPNVTYSFTPKNNATAVDKITQIYTLTLTLTGGGGVNVPNPTNWVHKWAFDEDDEIESLPLRRRFIARDLKILFKNIFQLGILKREENYNFRDVIQYFYEDDQDFLNPEPITEPSNPFIWPPSHTKRKRHLRDIIQDVPEDKEELEYGYDSGEDFDQGYDDLPGEYDERTFIHNYKNFIMKGFRFSLVDEFAIKQREIDTYFNKKEHYYVYGVPYYKNTQGTANNISPLGNTSSDLGKGPIIGDTRRTIPWINGGGGDESDEDDEQNRHTDDKGEKELFDYRSFLGGNYKQYKEFFYNGIRKPNPELDDNIRNFQTTDIAAFVQEINEFIFTNRVFLQLNSLDTDNLATLAFKNRRSLQMKNFLKLFYASTFVDIGHLVKNFGLSESELDEDKKTLISQVSTHVRESTLEIDDTNKGICLMRLPDPADETQFNCEESNITNDNRIVLNIIRAFNGLVPTKLQRKIKDPVEKKRLDDQRRKREQKELADFNNDHCFINILNLAKLMTTPFVGDGAQKKLWFHFMFYYTQCCRKNMTYLMNFIHFPKNRNKILNLEKKLETFIKQQNEQKMFTFLKFNNMNPTDRENERYNARYQIFMSKKNEQSIVIGYNDSLPAQLTVINNPSTGVAQFEDHYFANGKYRPRQFYHFGAFTKIFEPKLNNLQIAQDKNMEYLRKKAIEGNPIFMFGYGASGAGKTSSLIYFNGGKDANDRNGIITHLCNLLAKENGYTDLEINVKEFYDAAASTLNGGEKSCDSAEFSPSCDSRTIKFIFNGNKDSFDYKSDTTSGNDENNVIVEYLNNNANLHHTYRTNRKEGDKTPNSFDSKDTSLGNVLVFLVDKDRFVKATTNNPNSSRSHILIHIKITKNAPTNGEVEPSIPVNLFVGDFAGVENAFACDDPTILTNFAKVERDNDPWTGGQGPITPGSINRPYYMTEPKTDNTGSFDYKNANYETIFTYDDAKKVIDLKNLTLPDFQEQFKSIPPVNENLYNLYKQIINTEDADQSNNSDDFAENVTKGINAMKTGIDTERNKNIGILNRLLAELDASQKFESGRKAAEATVAQAKMEYNENVKNATIHNKIMIIEKALTDLHTSFSSYPAKSTSSTTNRTKTLEIITIVKTELNQKKGEIEKALSNNDQYNINFILQPEKCVIIFNNFGYNVARDLTLTIIFKKIPVKINEMLEYETIVSGTAALANVFGKKVSNDDFSKNYPDSTTKVTPFNHTRNAIELSNDKYYKTVADPGSVDDTDSNKRSTPDITKDITTIIATLNQDYKGYNANTATPIKEIVSFIYGNFDWFNKKAEFVQDTFIASPTTSVTFGNYFNDNSTQYTPFMDKIGELIETNRKVSNAMKEVCLHRLQEGNFINKSLKDLRENIADIMQIKNQNIVFYSPELNFKCISTFCPSRMNCFKLKKKLIPKDETFTSEMIKWIYNKYKQSFSPSDQATINKVLFYEKILISVFCVYNITASKNSYLAQPYTDTNDLKIMLCQYKKNPTDDELKTQIFDRLLSMYHNIYGTYIDGIGGNDNDKYHLHKFQDETHISNRTEYFYKDETLDAVAPNTDFKIVGTDPAYEVADENKKTRWNNVLNTGSAAKIQKIYNFLKNNTDPVLKPSILTTCMFNESITDEPITEENLFDQINLLIQTWDNINDATPIGTIKFLDSIAKLYTNNVICDVTKNCIDLNTDFERYGKYFRDKEDSKSYPTLSGTCTAPVSESSGGSEVIPSQSSPDGGSVPVSQNEEVDHTGGNDERYQNVRHSLKRYPGRPEPKNKTYRHLST